MEQKTFWCLVGDIINKEIEINEWLQQKASEGFELFARDQFERNGGVFITYTLTRSAHE